MVDRMAGNPGVAVVGVGMWGRNHARNYAEIGALAAVVDRDPEAAARVAAQHGRPARSFDEVLADPEIAGIVMALPPSQNLPLGRRALEAGKHLFVEKPMAMTTAEAGELLAVARRHDRRLMVGHILQYHPAFLALQGLVRDGTLGRLLSLTSTRLDLGRIRREEDALWALAPHDLSMILGLVGAEPEEVRAEGGYHTHATIADTAGVDLRFPGNVRAEIRVSWLHPFKEQRLVVVGEAAMAVFDDREPWDRKLVLYRHRLVDRAGVPFAERAEPEPVALEAGEPLRRECLHFLDAIRTGAEPVTNGEEGLRVLRVLERASASLAAR
ncbi:Gfo/Idh/MocA family oxidoreductase [Enterovirga sp.]|uniref:Gfo/Idh/MocA family protein n=1 Tax=Enterovirga sp. TaxID=2026350 RepID=UPI0026372136|nr:Gfo/Idh/MocA family oxidoreductase [Enterovirga sp.]MDB5592311.1 oxidoreductase [Enterovirga sp.]